MELPLKVKQLLGVIWFNCARRQNEYNRDKANKQDVMVVSSSK